MRRTGTEGESTMRLNYDPERHQQRRKASWLDIAIRMVGVHPETAEILWDLLTLPDGPAALRS